MKQINLLPWREQKNQLKIKQFVIVWLCVAFSCLLLLFISRALIIQKINHYQLVYDQILLQIKTTSPMVQEIKKLQYEEQLLTKIIKITLLNHQQFRKILDLLAHLKYLLSPDIFIRLIEFYPPYIILIMHANSEKRYLNIIKYLQIKYNSKLKTLIINKSKNSALDFIVKMAL